MKKMKAIIVDDELNARENLQYLLNEFCKEVIVVAEASNVDEAVLSIKEHQPDLVFLDVEMPNKNGFMLLEEFSEINFQIIFITAYDLYAVKAFEISALDYLLKPIDIQRLKAAVCKATKSIDSLNETKLKLKTLQENKRKLKKIAIPYKTDYAILDVNDVLCIEADRMYSRLYTNTDRKYIVAKKLSYYEDVLCNKSDFVRLHRSWIVNLNKIKTYSKKEREVILNTKFKIPISKSYKDNFEALFFA